LERDYSLENKPSECMAKCVSVALERCEKSVSSVGWGLG